jgi:hypothetical protein
VCSGVTQQADDVSATEHDGVVKRRITVSVTYVNRRPEVKQILDNVRVTFTAGYVQRRSAVVVGHLKLRPLSARKKS